MLVRKALPPGTSSCLFGEYLLTPRCPSPCLLLLSASAAFLHHPPLPLPCSGAVACRVPLSPALCLVPCCVWSSGPFLPEEIRALPSCSQWRNAEIGIAHMEWSLVGLGLTLSCAGGVDSSVTHLGTCGTGARDSQGWTHSSTAWPEGLGRNREVRDRGMALGRWRWIRDRGH